MPILYSVIIPVYNAGHFFSAVLNSVPPDLGEDFEIILVNDCSTDDTEKVIGSHPIFSRIRYFKTEKNSGPSTARNMGASKAEGQFLIFFDADVLFLPDTFKRLKAYVEKHPEVFCFTGIHSKKSDASSGFVSQFHSLYAYYALNLIPEGGPASTWNPRLGFVRRDLFWRLGGFDTTYRKADVEDYALSKKIEKVTPIGFTREFEIKHRFGSFIETTRNFFKRSRQWTHLFLKTKSLDKTGHTRISNGLNLLVSFLLAVFLVLSPLFSVRKILAFLLLTHWAVNFPLFLFFIREVGVFQAFVYLGFVLYYNWVVEFGIFVGIFETACRLLTSKKSGVRT